MKKALPLVLLAVAGCASPPPSEKSVGMPNPASIYCAEQGGKLEIRKGPDGETGHCHLPDGRVVEEWELYRSQHATPGAKAGPE